MYQIDDSLQAVSLLLSSRSSTKNCFEEQSPKFSSDISKMSNMPNSRSRQQKKYDPLYSALTLVLITGLKKTPGKEMAFLMIQIQYFVKA